jgi:hypothetical protein
MADKQIILSQRNVDDLIPLRARDNGDGTYSLAVAEERWTALQFSTAATHTIPGPIYIKELRIVGGTLGNITVHRGSVLDPVHYGPATPALGVLLSNLNLPDGATLVLASAMRVDVIYGKL